MFTPVKCHFELYASLEGTADEFFTLSERAEPIFKAFSLCFGLEVVFYNKVDGQYWITKEVDWTDETIRYYRFQAVYDCTEMKERNAKQILKAADELRKYHGFHWHEKRIEAIVSGSTNTRPF